MQANEVRNPERILVISGQTSIDADGHVTAVGNMAGQVAATLDNLETVLRHADMRLANLVRLNFYTTDIDRFMNEGTALLAERLAGIEYATTYLGIARLALPDLLIEMEATAAA